VKDYLIALLGSAAGLTAYGLIFVVLLAAGFGLPLPEDIPLVMGGVLVHRGQANLWVMILVGYLGIIIGDSIMFMLGRRFGTRVGSKPAPGFFGRIVTPEKRTQVEGLFKKHGEKIVMLARFLPGVRTVTYFTAGSVGMRYSHFVIYDSIAALASAPLFVVLGYYFGSDIEALLARIASGERKVLGVLVVLLVSYFLFNRWRARRKAKQQEEALGNQLVTQALEPAPVPSRQAEPPSKQ
jgi:membrane protein DedA with SNARE-associated domain